jgi:membrane-bound lytic murein transglycosylase A
MYHQETRTGHLSPLVTLPSTYHLLAFLLLSAATIALLNLKTMRPATIEPVSFADLPGWKQDGLQEAFSAFARSCAEIVNEGRGFSRVIMFGGKRADWTLVCREALAFEPDLSDDQARGFFEAHFKPFVVRDSRRPHGLFTGYFEPDAFGDRHRHGDFVVPVYGKPHDLVAFDPQTEKRIGLRYGRIDDNGQPRSYFTRRQIEEGALSGKGLEIAWLKSWADAFFMQVQGSGRIRLPDGSLLRLAYAAKSGLPYTAIGGVLVGRGEIPRADMSMQSIRRWMDDYPQEARELMWENQSFVFFREVALEDPTLGPIGAQHVQLTPFRSLAVDRAFWAFGTPLWIEAELPVAPETGEIFRRLMIAQDTGSAIKGAVRGDVFFGNGTQAAQLAGHMKSEGRLIALLPHAVVENLGGEIAK